MSLTEDETYEKLKAFWGESLAVPESKIWTAKDLGLDLHRRAADNWDNTVLLDGDKGSSKTTGEIGRAHV
jgi:hypothetical protein